MAENSIIRGCKCSNSFQDAEYGKGKRVFNLMGPKKDKGRCTVCSTVIVIFNTATISKKEEKG